MMSTIESVLQYIGIMVVVLIVLSIFIVKYYAEPGFPVHTSITVVICYFCAFGILLIIPPDIASAVVERNRTTSLDDYYNNIQFLSVFYNTLFVTILVMGSVVLVFQEYYNTDGYFTFWGRSASSFVRMMIPNIAGLIVGSIVLGILIKQNIVQQDISAIELTAIIITNIVYETFLMFLMGYGFIELPRSVWMQASLDSSLLSAQMKACSDFQDISESQTLMGVCVANVIKTRNEKAATFAKDAKLTNAMNILSAECPPEFRSSRCGEVMTNKQGKVTISVLANMRTKLNETKDRYRTAQTKVEATKTRAYRLMDLVEARRRYKAEGTKCIHWSLTNTNSTEWEYNWYMNYSPILLRLLAILLAFFSFFSFLGVISTMTGVANNSSVYFLAVHSGNPSFSGVLIFILVSMGYAVYVTLWSLFQMQFAGMMHLVPHRTSAVCLSFNARMCARLAAPLAFFYLGWLAESGIKSGDWLYRPEPSSIGYHNVTSLNPLNVTISTLEPYEINNDILMRSAFSHFYQMDRIGVFRQFFATLFPILLIIVMFLVLTNVLNYILVKLKLDYMQMGTLFVNVQQLEEGKRKLERYRKTSERSTQRMALKSKLLGMFSSGGVGNMSSLNKFFFVLFGGTYGADGDTTENHSVSGTVTQSKIAAVAGDYADGAHLAALLRRQPKEISGTLERKKNGVLGISNSWKTYRAIVMAPGVLVFSSADASSNSTPPPALDLSLVVNFTIPRSEDDVNTKLTLEMSDEIVRLKFKCYQDMEEWCESFKLWKEYAIDYGNYEQGDENRQLGAKLDDLKIDIEGDDDDDSGHHGFMHHKNPMNKADANTSTSADHGDIFNHRNTLITGYVPPLITTRTVLEKPTGITEGWLEKKKSSKMFSVGPAWQKRYCRIDMKTQCLMYGKTPSMSHDSSAATFIDLTVVSSILNEDSEGRSDSFRVTLVGVGGGNSSLMNDGSEHEWSHNAPMAAQKGAKVKIVQLRAASAEEGEEWAKSMNDWRDYFLMDYANRQAI